MTDRTNARLCLVAAALLFSTGGMVIKQCSLAAEQIASGRSLVAAIFLFACIPAGRRNWSRSSMLVALFYGATMVIFVLANKLTTSANAIFLQDTAPLFVLIVSPWLLKEKIRPTDYGIMAIIMVGMSLFFFGDEAAQATAPNPTLGNTLASISGLTWAGTIIGLRYLRSGSATRDNTAAPAIVLGNVMAFLACGYSLLSLKGISLADAGLLLYLGVVQIGLAYILVTRAVAHISALEASILLLLEPVINPIWSFAIHGERPGQWALVGGVVILAATTLKAAVDSRHSRREKLNQSS